MKTSELAKPTVASTYVLQTLQLAQDRGVSPARMLAGLDISAEQLEQPDARLGLFKYGTLCLRALQLTGEPALGYEFGLRSSLTAHGFFGFGLMCQPTLRAAIEFATRFFAPLRAPGWDARFLIEDGQAISHIFETVPYGILRQYALDMLMVSLVTTFRALLPPQPAIELWFDCEEPAYYARYRARLPAVRFNAGANQLRLPQAYLDLRIDTANASSARLIERECERELALLGRTDDLLQRVRAALLHPGEGYPDLPQMAERLHLTPRTLVRRLHEHGTSFQALLDEARHRDSLRLLQDPTLTLADIAMRVGFSTPANFSRAFRGWTGATPGRFRGRQQT